MMKTTTNTVPIEVVQSQRPLLVTPRDAEFVRQFVWIMAKGKAIALDGHPVRQPGALARRVVDAFGNRTHIQADRLILGMYELEVDAFTIRVVSDRFPEYEPRHQNGAALDCRIENLSVPGLLFDPEADIPDRLRDPADFKVMVTTRPVTADVAPIAPATGPVTGPAKPDAVGVRLWQRSLPRLIRLVFTHLANQTGATPVRILLTFDDDDGKSFSVGLPVGPKADPWGFTVSTPARLPSDPKANKVRQVVGDALREFFEDEES